MSAQIKTVKTTTDNHNYEQRSSEPKLRIIRHDEASELGDELEDKIRNISTQILGTKSDNPFEARLYNSINGAQFFTPTTSYPEEDPIFVGSEYNQPHGLIAIISNLSEDTIVEGELAYGIAQLPFIHTNWREAYSNNAEKAKSIKEKYGCSRYNSVIREIDTILKDVYVTANAFDLAERKGYNLKMKDIVAKEIEQSGNLFPARALQLLVLATMTEGTSKTELRQQVLEDILPTWKQDGQTYFEMAEEIVINKSYKDSTILLETIFEYYPF